MYSGARAGIDEGIGRHSALPLATRQAGGAARSSFGKLQPKGPLGIPKGLPETGEELEAAARRETLEEASVTAGKLVSLSSIDYRKSRKRVHCFAGERPPMPSRGATRGRSIRRHFCRWTRPNAASIRTRRRFSTV